MSSILYAKAKELVKSGMIGQIHLLEAYINRNSSLGAWQYTIPPDAFPETIDWDQFLGSAPNCPFAHIPPGFDCRRPSARSHRKLL